MTETKLRSFLKAISWRVIATMITFFAALVFTGEVILAIEIGLLDTLIKIGAYFLHERLWGSIMLGKKIHPLADIKLKRALDTEDKELIKEKLREMGYLE